MKEKNLFEEAKEINELPTEELPTEDYSEEKEFFPKINKKSPKELLESNGVKVKADGRILTIKGYGFTKPRITGDDGLPMEPKSTISKTGKFYSGKLKIYFDEENIVDYYPNFKYFVNDNGVINETVRIFRDGNNAVAQMFNLAIKKMGKSEEEVSDLDFFEWLVGKKAKIKTVTGKFNGEEWFRNDIEEFI
jgi:hypothetical protein